MKKNLLNKFTIFLNEKYYPECCPEIIDFEFELIKLLQPLYDNEVVLNSSFFPNSYPLEYYYRLCIAFNEYLFNDEKSNEDEYCKIKNRIENSNKQLIKQFEWSNIYPSNLDSLTQGPYNINILYNLNFNFIDAIENEVRGNPFNEFKKHCEHYNQKNEPFLMTYYRTFSFFIEKTKVDKDTVILIYTDIEKEAKFFFEHLNKEYCNPKVLATLIELINEDLIELIQKKQFRIIDKNDYAYNINFYKNNIKFYFYSSLYYFVFKNKIKNNEVLFYEVKINELIDNELLDDKKVNNNNDNIFIKYLQDFMTTLIIIYYNDKYIQNKTEINKIGTDILKFFKTFYSKFDNKKHNNDYLLKYFLNDFNNIYKNLLSIEENKLTENEYIFLIQNFQKSNK